MPDNPSSSGVTSLDAGPVAFTRNRRRRSGRCRPMAEEPNRAARIAKWVAGRYG